MSRKISSQKIDVRVPTDARDALTKLAKSRNEETTASDIIREAIEEYLLKHGIRVPLEVEKRGGYRRNHSAQQSA